MGELACYSPEDSAILCADHCHFRVELASEFHGCRLRFVLPAADLINSVMILTTRLRHTYDHRLRDLARSRDNIEHAIRRGIPRSTARGWLAARHARVLTLDFADQDHQRLQKEVLALRRRVDRLLALERLMVVLWKVSGFSLSALRFPDQASRLRLLQAIDRVHAVLPLRTVLRIIGLSQSRYHNWKREPPCGLEDAVICPRSAPRQLTLGECTAIQEMVTSEEYRHVPTGTLALLAQRPGKVYASPTTWIDSCAASNGGDPVNALIHRVLKSVFVLRVPMRSGKSTRR